MQSNGDGLLVLDKPAGITSRDAVDAAQKWFPRGTKIGHTGTLDPFATGVLVLCLGNATRLAEYVQRMSKTYLSTFVLGATSDTDDPEGVLTVNNFANDPGREAVTAALASMVGEISQVPPAYSAAKVDGRRAYKLARKGEDVSLSARTIRVHGIDVLDCAWPEVTVEVRCGKGTYIRSLARDLGRTLGCGGYCRTLRRLCVGPFRAEEGLSPDSSEELARSRLLPIGLALAELPRIVLPSQDVPRFRAGQRLEVSICPEGEVGVFDETGDLVAVGLCGGGVLRPVKVMAL